MNEIFSNLSNHKVHRYIFSNDEFTKDLLEGLLPLIHENTLHITLILCNV